ncbi:hypothetical protein ELI37_19855 [Rhizobium leguminosarum]|uniref:hypothetical protein n=1 Tax=Rhizobium leguminosarum TaxID=384 RepID=UPI0010323FA8|nr:hypothetical protein [Rhizobium leguminosarum]TAV12594.1 hypothetical protein ELI37_19855 [Rhizobium leguminosarum]
MAVVVADAIASARRDPHRRISYSRRKGWWTNTSRYRDRDYTYDTVVPAVDALVNAGILVDHDLQPAGRATGIQSSYRPAGWLAGTNAPKLQKTQRELIRLKDAYGNLTGYRDTERTQRERRLVEKVNRLIGETEISLASPDAVADGDTIRFGNHTVYPEMCSLYRVFNGGWTLGGRYYGGWWQSVKSKDREHFVLNNQRTVEVDYEQLHPRLLYALAGEHLEGDAYTLPGWKRKTCKVAFNVLLNASGYHQARGALLQHVDGDDLAAAALISDIKAKHPNVAEYFHTGVGLRLQHVDAEMCRFVLSEMSVRKGVVVLPVHDSFIVPEAARDELILTMKNALKRATQIVADR